MRNNSQMTHKNLEEFLRKLRAKATIKSQPRYSYTPWDYTTASEYAMNKRMEYEETVEMVLPLEKLKEIVETLHEIELLQTYYGPSILTVGQHVMVDKMMLSKEARIRDNNPAVKKAWEHYQTMLNLVRNDND